MWPAFGIWRGVFEVNRPAVAGALDELAGAGIGADWGARMLSRESTLYAPLSYNNGAAWPFLSGFAILALYSQHRPDAAWLYLDGTADLTFLEPRGYVPELFSGDRLRSIDAAVPHQLFATTGFVSGLMRGLVGLREPSLLDPAGALTIEPQLPAGWTSLRLRRVRWRDARFDIDLTRGSDRLDLVVTNRGQPRPLAVRLALPPGAEAERDTRELRFTGTGTERRSVRLRPGFELVPVHEPLRLGDMSQRLRVIATAFDGRTYTARLQGRRGRYYRARLRVPSDSVFVEGADVRNRDGRWIDLEVRFDGDREWVEQTVQVKLPSNRVRVRVRGVPGRTP